MKKKINVLTVCTSILGFVLLLALATFVQESLIRPILERYRAQQEESMTRVSNTGESSGNEVTKEEIEEELKETIISEFDLSGEQSNSESKNIEESLNTESSINTEDSGLSIDENSQTEQEENSQIDESNSTEQDTRENEFPLVIMN